MMGVRRPSFLGPGLGENPNVEGGRGHGSVEVCEGSWVASRKRDVVVRLLRGESLDTVSREVGVELYRLEAWKTRAPAGWPHRATPGYGARRCSDPPSPGRPRFRF